jgi:hypothetical protein
VQTDGQTKNSETKEIFKNHGVATSLLLHAFPNFNSINEQITYTHRTFDGDVLIRHRRDFKFNPFILYKKEGEIPHG